MKPGQTATILRDAYGVPHVFADSEADALFGFGYAQAEDRLETMLAHYLAADGEAASVLGASYLERDIAVRAFRLPEIAAKRYGELSEEVREGIEAFAAGINQYQADFPEKCPEGAFVVAPEDIVALSLTYNLYFATDHFERSPSTFGSNGFAVAGERTASGNAIVSLDPHLPISGALRWYEGHICGGEMNVYGVTFVGIPYIVMGTNGNIAWANTVNDPDLSDLYEVRLHQEPGKPPVYEYDGKTRPCEVRNYTFSVRQGNGIQTVNQTILSTHQGPILIESNDKRYAIRKAGVGDIHVLTQVRQQCLARTVDEYRTALAGCHLVMFNHLFGDSNREIGYISGGQVPRRPDGYDFHAPVPGWTSATEWGAPLTIDQLPQAIRPASGFVQNCNDAPGYCGAEDMQVAPPYPAWLTEDVRTLRGDHLRGLLAEETALTTERARAIATDCTDLNAKRELAELDNLVRVSVMTGVMATQNAELFTEIQRYLREWDGTLTAEAKGAALFQAWLLQPFIQDHLSVGSYVAPDYADTLPLARRFPKQCANALENAANWLLAYGYPLDVEWGKLHRLQREHVDLPCDGGLDSLCPNGGHFDEATGVTTMAFGSSYRCLVELVPGGKPQIWACLPWGNSDDPASPHFADQLPLAAKRAWRIVPWTRGEVEKEMTGTKLLRSL